MAKFLLKSDRPPKKIETAEGLTLQFIQGLMIIFQIDLHSASSGLPWQQSRCWASWPHLTPRHIPTKSQRSWVLRDATSCGGGGKVCLTWGGLKIKEVTESHMTMSSFLCFKQGLNDIIHIVPKYFTLCIYNI